MKKYFIFSSLIMAILSVLIGSYIVKSAEYNSPLGADASFVLRLGDAKISKAQVVEDLTRIANENDAILLKAVTNSQTYRSERDLISFSAEVPKESVPVIDASGKITWLNDGMTGRLLPVSELGDNSISGAYNITHSVQGKEDLQRWAQTYGLVLEYSSPKSFSKQFLSMFTQNGLLLSYIAILLLNFALVVADVLSRTYLRTLQLLNGLAVKSIHLSQYVRVAGRNILGAGIGILICCAYAFSVWAGQTTVAVLCAALPYFIGGVVFEILTVILVSYIFAPNVKLIRTRSLPEKQYRRVNSGIQMLATGICVVACLPAVALGKNALISYQQQAQAKIMGQAVSVSLKGYSHIDTPEGLRDLQHLLAKPELQDTAVLAYSLGSSIDLSADTLGEYDSLDIVNQNLLDFFKIPQESLNSVEWEEFSPRLQEFLDGQLRLFIPETEESPRNRYRFYTPSGDTNYVSVGANVGYGGEITKTDHPLIIVPLMPVSQMDMSGIIMPAISTGNLFFTDSEKAEDAWYSSSLASSVLSIDRIADINLISAQYFRTQVISYIATIAVSLLLVVVTAWQGALIWARGNYKYIFIALTAGVEMKKLYTAQVKKTFMLICAVAFPALVAVIALFPAFSDPVTNILTLLILLLLFRGVSVSAYVFNIRRIFENLILRRI